ncbi:exocyst complex component EXO84 [Phakopsora pachyrhizi]|uniref:Exocyst complex component EXO84 n=1 Tax=Phakopsora pachyrhizi TaxID=170000 RepID=A0AAV0BE24_PHAPC|nr:exocyst complex component EXO84 [Phakopsora pachyrhizi]
MIKSNKTVGVGVGVGVGTVSLRTNRPTNSDKTNYYYEDEEIVKALDKQSFKQFQNQNNIIRSNNDRSKINEALLNKRQSVSYGHQSIKSSIPLPPLPDLPNNLVKLSGGGGTVVSGHTTTGGGVRRYEDRIIGKSQIVRSLGLDIDIDTLSQESFEPESFIKIHLSLSEKGSSDPEALRSFKNSLRATRLATNQELQENAYRNYSAFVMISKEMVVLENEMLELRSVLDEFKTLPDDLSMTLRNLEGNLSLVILQTHSLYTSSSSSSSYRKLRLIHHSLPTIQLKTASDIRRRLARNSVADVNQLYKSQLETLWESIEGSQKYLTLKPGRHIVSEIKNFFELNPLTYQQSRPIYIFLLNDSLLIAIRKRVGMSSGRVKLVAEKFFLLTQISIVDLVDSNDLKNAIQIKSSRETVVLRTDRFEFKRDLLNSFKNLAEEMSNRRLKQSIIQPKTPVSSAFTLNSNISNNSPQIEPSSMTPGSDLSWIQDLSDELSTLNLTRRFEESVDLLDRSKHLLQKIHHNSSSSIDQNNVYLMLRSKLEERSLELVNVLLHDLLHHSLTKTELVRISSLIGRLTSSTTQSIDRAKDNFLRMRSELIRQQTKRIRFEGDLLLWVSQSAFVFFTLIKNSCEWYMTAFRDNQVASGFVRWAVDQIELYGELFRNQVYDNNSLEERDMSRGGKDAVGDEGTRKSPSVVPLAITQAHAGILKEVGLNFSFLLEMVLKDPRELTLQSQSSKSRGLQRMTGEVRELEGLEERYMSKFQDEKEDNNNNNNDDDWRGRGTADGNRRMKKMSIGVNGYQIYQRRSRSSHLYRKGNQTGDRKINRRRSSFID